MKRYWIVTGVILALFLASFGIMEALHLSFLQDPTNWMRQRGGWTAGLVGVGLLTADVFLPIPSSLVMIAHGGLFGILLGAGLSLLGSVLAAMLGFALGRRGGPLLARMVTPREKAQADGILRKWGALAILITRPIPLMAETVTILAGASPMGWGKMILASLFGSAPAALLYAVTGATAQGFASGLLMFAVVILVAGLFWFLGKKIA